MRKQFLGILTALALCLSLCPAAALAAETEPEPAPQSPYERLQAQFNEGGEITLTENVDLEAQSLTVPEGTTVTLDCGQYAIAEAKFGDTIAVDGTLRFKGGTVNGTVAVAGGGTATVEGGTIKSLSVTFNDSQPGTAQLSGGTYGTLFAGGYNDRLGTGKWVYRPISAILAPGYALRGADGYIEGTATGEQNNVTVEKCPHPGGFTVADTAHSLDCPYCGTEIASQPHTDADEDSACDVCNAALAAQAGDVYYTDISNAIEAGGTVKLLADVSFEGSLSSCTLDLNGHNITGTIEVGPGERLTLTGTGTINGAIELEENATLTLPANWAFYKDGAPVPKDTVSAPGSYTLKECGHEGAEYSRYNYTALLRHNVNCPACEYKREDMLCELEKTGDTTFHCKKCDLNYIIAIPTSSEVKVQNRPSPVYDGTDKFDGFCDVVMAALPDRTAWNTLELWDPYRNRIEMKDVGDYTVTFIGYLDANLTFEFPYTITPAPLDCGDLTVQCAYGETPEITAKPTFNGAAVDGAWALTGLPANAAVRDEPYPCTATFTPDSDNYQPLTKDVAVTVVKAEYTGTKELEVIIRKGTEKTVDLSMLIPEDGKIDGFPAAAGDIFYSLDVGDTSLTIKLTDDAQGTGELQVRVESTNYESLYITVKVTSTDKYVVDIEGLTLTGRPYDGTELAPAGTPVARLDGEPVQVEFEYAWSAVPKDVGTYKLTVSVKENADYTGSVTLTAQIIPVQVTVTAPSRTIKVGEEAPAFTAADCNVSGLASGEALGGALSVAYASAPDTSKAGTVAVIASGAEVPSANYSGITYVNGTLTIQAPSSGGGGGSGTVTPDPGPDEPGPVDPAPGPDDPNPPQPGGEEIKLEVKPGISEVPPALLGNPSLNTPEKLEAAMRAAITQLATGIPARNVAVYDVTLMVSFDGGLTWTEATEENFPSSGQLTVTLPYPAGTDRNDQFTVAHMFTASCFGHTPGDIERPAVTNVPDGIRFTVTGLSPISVGWTKAAPVEPDRPVTPSRPSGGGASSSGDSSYAVKVERPSHGQVTSNRTSASSGSTVTLTVTPDSGYALDTLTVTDSRGTAIKLTSQGSGKYTFPMPSRSVTVTASFALAQTPWRNPYSDVAAGAWYYDAVQYVTENGLMNGLTNTLFAPDASLSRAQLAQILYNRAGRPAVAGGSAFADVAPGAWYADAVVWAAANGIVSGYGDGRFGPDDHITREQLAVMLWRYAGTPAPPNLLLIFPDASTASGYALDALRWALDQGIISGYSDGQLAPNTSATRGQAAQILKNLLAKL